MVSRDLISNAQPLHLVTSLTYTVPKLSDAVEISSYSGGVILLVNILSASGDATIQIQESPDNSSYTSVSGLVFTESSGTPSTTRPIFLHPNKVGPWIKVLITPDTNIICGVTGVAFGRLNGQYPSTTYLIDSGS